MEEIIIYFIGLSTEGRFHPYPGVLANSPPFNPVKWGVDEGLITPNPSGSPFSKDLRVFISNNEEHISQYGSYDSPLTYLTQKADLYNVRNSAIGNLMQSDAANNFPWQEHREPCDVILPALEDHPAMKEWISGKGNHTWVGSQRPLNAIMSANSGGSGRNGIPRGMMGYVVNVRPVERTNTCDVFLARDMHSDMTKEYKKRTAIGQLLESKVLHGESIRSSRLRSKKFGIFYVNLTENIRYLYHTELDWGRECGDYGIEFKTKTLFHKNYDIQKYLEKSLYRYKLKNMYLKCLLSGLQTAVLCVVEECPLTRVYLGKSMRYYNAAHIPCMANPGEWDEKTVGNEFQAFQTFLRDMPLENSGAGFQIIGTKPKYGGDQMTCSIVKKSA